MGIKYTILENGFDFILSAINNLTIATDDTIDEEAKKLIDLIKMIKNEL